MTNDMTQEAIAAQIKKIIKEHVDTDEALAPETHLQDDLAIDSLERVELGIKLEKAFGIELSNKKVRSVVALEDFIQLVISQIDLQKREGDRG